MDPKDLQPIEVTVVRKAKDCSDDEECPTVTKVNARPGRHYFVGILETDPEILAAHAGKIGPGEALFWEPDTLIPELNQ